MERVQIRQYESNIKTDKVQCFDQKQAELFLSILDDPLMYHYNSSSRKNPSTGKIQNYQDYQAAHTIPEQLKLFFYLAMFTGCRRGELIALEWSDFNFEDSTVSITKSTCRVDGKNITKTTKTKGSIRLIAIPHVVTDMAKRWKINQMQQRLQSGSQWEGSDYVFIQINGKQMGLDTPYHAFHRIINNYNANKAPDDPILPLIPLHGLRHTAATLLIGRGVDLRTVSGRLGHSSTSTTLNIYAHALKELDRNASDELESLFTLSKTK